MSDLIEVIRDVVSFLGVSVGDLGGVVVSSEGEVGGRWAMSSRMDLCFLVGIWDVFSEKFSIPECLSARSVYSDDILVKLAYFDDDASLVPFVWVMVDLVLDPHSVAYF